MTWFSALSFVWSYVIPVIKEIAEIFMAGTYGYIKDRVDDADILDLKGLEKRTRVYKETRQWLELNEDVDPSTVSSAAIYLMIEIAVANLKKKQKKLMKRNNARR